MGKFPCIAVTYEVWLNGALAIRKLRAVVDEYYRTRGGLDKTRKLSWALFQRTDHGIPIASTACPMVDVAEAQARKPPMDGILMVGCLERTRTQMGSEVSVYRYKLYYLGAIRRDHIVLSLLAARFSAGECQPPLKQAVRRFSSRHLCLDVEEARASQTPAHTPDITQTHELPDILPPFVCSVFVFHRDNLQYCRSLQSVSVPWLGHIVLTHLENLVRIGFFHSRSCTVTTTWEAECLAICFLISAFCYTDTLCDWFVDAEVNYLAHRLQHMALQSPDLTRERYHLLERNHIADIPMADHTHGFDHLLCDRMEEQLYRALLSTRSQRTDEDTTLDKLSISCLKWFNHFIDRYYTTPQ